MKCEASTSLYTAVSGSLLSSVTLIIHCENQLNVDGFGVISEIILPLCGEGLRKKKNYHLHQTRLIIAWTGFFQSVSGADRENC